ncbi:MAG: MerR family transcriptional regulator [Coriobacteriales bacterium]|nr:MerR family transcriptional regulator [Coriobacteriales bacterium]
MSTSYTIGEAARQVGLSVSTLRFYHQHGLMPHVERTEGGQRRFSPGDIEWIRYLERLKATGMPLAEMREFVQLIDGGEATLERRREIMRARREAVLRQIEQLETTLGIIEYKCWYYDKALELGDEQAARALSPEDMPEEILGARELCQFE